MLGRVASRPQVKPNMAIRLLRAEENADEENKGIGLYVNNEKMPSLTHANVNKGVGIIMRRVAREEIAKVRVGSKEGLPRHFWQGSMEAIVYISNF